MSSVNETSWASPEARSSWTLLASMSECRQGGVAATIAGTIYVCGGFNGRFDLRSAERHVVSTGLWQPLPDMEERRHGALAAAVGNRFYVCGGFNGPTLGAAEFLDTLTH